MAVAYPEELTGPDLYEVWTNVSELTERFDPFRFEHRVAAYRGMIEATGAGGLFGVDNRRNPLWALLFQLHW